MERQVGETLEEESLLINSLIRDGDIYGAMALVDHLHNSDRGPCGVTMDFVEQLIENNLRNKKKRDANAVAELCFAVGPDRMIEVLGAVARAGCHDLAVRLALFI